jgi:hypothetical protein
LYPAATLLFHTNAAQVELESPRKSTLFNYSPGDHFPPLCKLLPADVARCRSLSPNVDGILRVVISSALRFAEVSSLCQADRCGPDRFLVRGRKRSRDSALLLPGIDAQLELHGDPSPALRLFSARYRVVWTQLHRAHLQTFFCDRKRAVLTHLGRYRLAASVVGLSGMPAVTSVLHHKSAHSAEYYTQHKEFAYGSP